MPDVPCPHATTGQPSDGGVLPFGMKTMVTSATGSPADPSDRYITR